MADNIEIQDDIDFEEENDYANADIFNNVEAHDDEDAITNINVQQSFQEIARQDSNDEG